MENKLTLNDIKRFLLAKKTIIILTTLITAVIITGLSVFWGMDETETDQETETPSEEVEDLEREEIETLLAQGEDDLSDSEVETIEEFLFEEAYSFRVYMEHQDGSVFDRSNLMETILASEAVVQEVEDVTGIDLDLGLYDDYFIDVNLNSYNVVFTITFGLGNSELSEAVSNAYYTFFQNENIGILNDRNIYLFSEPEPVETEEEAESTDEPVATEESLSTSTILLSVIGGLILGLGFGLLAAFLSALFDKKITHIYNLNLTSRDKYINYASLPDKGNMEDQLLHAILYPTAYRKIVLVQDQALKDTLIRETEETAFSGSIVSQLHELDPSHTFDELILVLQTGVTDKKWYTEQKTQMDIYNLPVKIIRI